MRSHGFTISQGVSKHFTHMVLCSSHNSPGESHSHFADEETEAQRLGNFPWVRKPVRGGSQSSEGAGRRGWWYPSGGRRFFLGGAIWAGLWRVCRSHRTEKQWETRASLRQQEEAGFGQAGPSFWIVSRGLPFPPAQGPCKEGITAWDRSAGPRRGLRNRSWDWALGSEGRHGGGAQTSPQPPQDPASARGSPPRRDTEAGGGERTGDPTLGEHDSVRVSVSLLNVLIGLPCWLSW